LLPLNIYYYCYLPIYLKKNVTDKIRVAKFEGSMRYYTLAIGFPRWIHFAGGSKSVDLRRGQFSGFVAWSGDAYTPCMSDSRPSAARVNTCRTREGSRRARTRFNPLNRFVVLSTPCLVPRFPVRPARPVSRRGPKDNTQSIRSAGKSRASVYVRNVFVRVVIFTGAAQLLYMYRRVVVTYVCRGTGARARRVRRRVAASRRGARRRSGGSQQTPSRRLCSARDPARRSRLTTHAIHVPHRGEGGGGRYRSPRRRPTGQTPPSLPTIHITHTHTHDTYLYIMYATIVRHTRSARHRRAEFIRFYYIVIRLCIVFRNCRCTDSGFNILVDAWFGRFYTFNCSAVGKTNRFVELILLSRLS